MRKEPTLGRPYQVWSCKIGIKGDCDLPGGCDLPMRQAIKQAFFEITGIDADFCFSGWNSNLDPVEAEVVEEGFRKEEERNR